MSERIGAPAARGVFAAGPFAALVLAAALALAACGPSGKVAEGIVTDVQETGLTAVSGFTLRTKDGQEMRFAIGQLELDGNAFDAGHLQVHRLSAQPVAVAYREQDGKLIAYRLVDAPWAQ
jgi:hypothetical protein